MKWLFFLLLLANLLFYGYTRLAEPPPRVDWQSREVKADKLKQVMPEPPKPVVATSGEPGSEASKPEPETVAANDAEARPEAKPDSKPEAKTEPTDKQPGQTKPALACFAWRGILPEDLPNVRKQLAALKLGGEVRLESSEPDGPKRFWVYIPPRPSNEDAQKKADELKALGVEDYFVVNDGSRWNHAISLGLFSSQEAADRRLEMLRQKGVRSAISRERGDTATKSLIIKQVAKTAKAELSKAASGFKGSAVSETGC